MAGFFTEDTFKFLSQLKKNNNREWFAANKDRYEEHLREPFLEFIAAAGPQLRKISPNIVADPRPQGGSLFRIHRDVRFSKDKSPYKTNAGAHFRHAVGKSVTAPSYYLHLGPDEIFLAGGIYMPDAKGLQMIREGIVDRPREWKAAKAKVPLNYTEDRLIRAPKGFDPNHEFVEDLKMKHYISSVMLSRAQVCSPRFMNEFIAGCKSMTPLMKFLASAVGAAW